MIATLLPYAVKENEHIAEAIVRMEEIDKRQKEISKFQDKLLIKNTAFKKRIELNNQLKQVEQELQQFL